jgi:hypothetical protein
LRLSQNRAFGVVRSNQNMRDPQHTSSTGGNDLVAVSLMGGGVKGEVWILGHWDMSLFSCLL